MRGNKKVANLKVDDKVVVGSPRYGHVYRVSHLQPPTLGKIKISLVRVCRCWNVKDNVILDLGPNSTVTTAGERYLARHKPPK